MKKPLRILLKTALIVMAMFCLATFAFADGEIAGADFNDGAMHWSISADGVLTISGEGDTPDYSYDNHAPWYAYRSQITSVVIEDGITGMGCYALSGLENVVSIELPNTLNNLGQNCFSYCISLKTIDLPDGISDLPYGLFENCSSLESIAIPDGVAYLGSSNVFYNCRSLSEIHLPASIKRIGDYSEWDQFGNVRIRDIFFAGTLSQWMDVDFVNNGFSLPMQQPCNLYFDGEKLTNLTIPAEVTSIPDDAFQYVNLNSVTIPSNVTSVGEGAFYSSSVQSVRMADSVTSVGTNAFANCSSLDKVYYVGDQSKWSSIAWNSGNDALIDAPRYYIDSFDDIRTVTVGAVENGSVTISDAYCVPGDIINVSASPDPGYRLQTIIVNGVPIDGSSFVAEEGVDYVVTAEFEFYMDVKDSGSCGTNLTWTLYDNNELVISGTGEMADYYSNNGNAPWYNYRGIIESVIINEGVTSIGAYAFQNCTALTLVELPDSLEHLGDYTFENCDSLISLKLPLNTKTVGFGVFRGCNIDSLYFEGTINDWLQLDLSSGGFLFYVDSLYISGELIENLAIPDGVSSIQGWAFSQYSKIKTVVIPATVTTIGDGAFNCRNLVYAEFLGDAPSIGADAFYIDRNNENGFVIYYHENTHGWSSPLWDVYYAACVEEFSDYSVLDEDNRNSQGILFTLNESAKTAVVGDGSNTPNNSGYYGAQRGAVIIPDTVVKDGSIYRVIGIGPYAFSENRHVTSVSIGSGVTSILPTAFVGCPELKSITVSEGNEYYCSIDGVLYDVGTLYLYVYPGGKADESFTVPETVQTIGSYAFYDNEHIRTLTVGRNVTAIYNQAFCGLTNLTEITLPFIGTRENVGEGFPYYSSWFEEAFGDGTFGVNSLGGWNGGGLVGSLKKVTILGGDLYARSFTDCAYLEEINLPAIPSVIPERCFSGCTSLKKLTFAGNVCEIGNLVLPEGIESIGAYGFYGCTGIASVTLPASLTSIESSVFSGAGVEEFAVAAGNLRYSTDEWGVLYNYDKTTLIQYPSCRVWPYYNVADTTTSIAANAFSGCSTLVNLYIPNTVTSISTNFRYCPYLTICCYTNSAAYRYAHNNGLTAWYMDNKTLQGISVYSLPEQTVQTEGAVNLAGLYIVGDYGGRELQIDDYTLSYDDQTSGLKTVTVEYMGKTATFEMVFYTTEAGNIISFRTDEDLDGVMVMISLYNSDGAMIYCGNAAISNGEAQIGVSDDVYDAADHAKLLILDESNYTPTAAAQEISV